MPLIAGRVANLGDEQSKKLAQTLTDVTVQTLKVCFAGQLGYTDDKVAKVAQETIGKFAPGWVWVHMDPFSPIVAGSAAGKTPSGRFDIVLLENALDEQYQNMLTEAVAKAARDALSAVATPIHLAVAHITGNVDMSVPGSADSLLTAGGVHKFLRGEIDAALQKAGIPSPVARTAPGKRSGYYAGLAGDYSRPGLVKKEVGETLLKKAKEYIGLREKAMPAIDGTYSLQQIEKENKEWWPTHCEALRQGQADLLAGEYRDELVYFCQDGPFYGREAGTDIEKSWWKILSQPGVTMSWPIVMFHGEIVYFEWKCTDDATNETTAKGNVTFVRRGHRGAVHLKTEQLTFYRDVHAKFFQGS